jgi:hypothetical protein
MESKLRCWNHCSANNKGGNLFGRGCQRHRTNQPLSLFYRTPLFSTVFPWPTATTTSPCPCPWPGSGDCHRTRNASPRFLLPVLSICGRVVEAAVTFRPAACPCLRICRLHAWLLLKNHRVRLYLRPCAALMHSEQVETQEQNNERPCAAAFILLFSLPPSTSALPKKERLGGWPGTPLAVVQLRFGQSNGTVAQNNERPCAAAYLAIFTPSKHIRTP